MKNRSSIINCSIGNILEWYDFGLFTIFTPLFSKLFFPPEHPNTALIYAIAVFSIGFICRPIGALIFGYLGDKHGRATTLRMSILMMVLPTLVIGFLPTYQQVGILAPILLTITRIWQGISIGGEYGGSLIYLAETAPSQKRALFTSFASMGANSGILLAELSGITTTLLMSTDSLDSWGWRIPYIISGIICFAIYKYRLRIKETEIFHHLKAEHKLSDNPILSVFKENKSALLQSIGLVCMGSTFYFFMFYYLATSVKQASYNLLFLILLMICFIPISAMICDKIGRRKAMLINFTLIFLSIIPSTYLIESDSIGLVMIGWIWMTLASASEQGATPITVIEIFPAATRYTGVSLGYNIGNGILGGTAPLICQWLATLTKFTLSPSIYITCCAMVTGMVVYCFIPTTKGSEMGSNASMVVSDRPSK